MTSAQKVTLVDCTLRDGGYYNDWDYSADLIRRYVDSMERARVDVIEMGFRRFGADRELEPGGSRGHLLCHLAQGRCARIVSAVDAMAEAHDQLAPAEAVPRPRLRTVDRTDLVKLAEDLRRRTTVQRALQRTDCADDG